MSTEASAPSSGNMNLEQLAVRLSTKPSGAPSPESVKPNAEAAPSGEPTAPKEGDPAQAPDLSNKSPEAVRPEGEQTEDKSTEAEPLAEGELEPGAEPEVTEPEAEPEPEVQADELPAELREAIEIAKTQGAKGLADVLKRVHKLTGDRKAAEQAAAAAKTELERVKAEKSAEPIPVAAAGGEHPAVAKMNDDIAGCDSYLEWCEANPDGGELKVGDQVRVFDAKGVQTLRKNANDYRTELVANRSQARQVIKADFQAKETHFHKEAVRVYPWIAQKDSAERKEMDEMLQHAPQLRSFPDYELVLGDYVRGRKARMAAGKAPAPKPKARVEPPKIVTDAPGAQPAPKPKGEKEVEESKDRFAKTGSTDALAKMFAAQKRGTRR